MRTPGLLLIAGAIITLVTAAGCGSDTPVQPGNHPPHIQGITAIPDAVPRLGRTQLAVLASDSDGDILRYRWSAPAGSFSDSSEYRITWTAPDAPGNFRVKVVVSDGKVADSTSISVSVGSGTIYVTSDPPGFAILLDNQSTGRTTPDSLRRVAVGTYSVSLTNTLFRFAPSETTVTVADGRIATANFRIPPVATEVADIGPPVDEIGALAYTRFGLGVLYAARSGSDSTLRSASLAPTHSGENGRILDDTVMLLEPISVRAPDAGPAEVAYVKAGQIRIATLADANNDGLLDSLDNRRALQGTLSESYGPAFNIEGTMLAFTLFPTTVPGSDQYILAGVYSNAQVSHAVRVTQHGNALSFGPAPMAVYVSGGEIYQVEFDTLRVWPATQITQTGGNARAPAVSPDGHFVAYIDARGWLQLLALDSGKSVKLLDGLASYYVAWRSDGRELLIADNSQPGNARLRLVYNLPIP